MGFSDHFWKKARVILFLFIPIFFVGGGAEVLAGELPLVLQEVIEENRLLFPADQDRFEEKRKKLFEPLPEPNEPPPEKIAEKGPMPRPFVLTRTSALKDVEYLFRILRYGYAGYHHFGGDQAFFAARDRVKKRLKEGFPVLFRNTLERILWDELEFIYDQHFFLGGKKTGPTMHQKIAQDYELQQKSGQFSLIQGEKLLPLLEINGQEPDKFLKPSLNSAGKLVFRPVIFSSRPGPEQLIFRLEEEQKEILLQSAGRAGLSGETLEVQKKQDVPLVQLRCLHIDREQRALRQDLLESARDLRGAEVAILDIRGNQGGTLAPARDWIRGYSGQSPLLGVFEFQRRTKTAQTLAVAHTPHQEEEEVLKQIERFFSPVPQGWSLRSLPSEGEKLPRIANEGWLVVLIDRETASAAEAMVRMLHQLENVIFIGTRTAGAFMVGNSVFFHLPRSGISLQFGLTLFWEMDLKNREGKGLAPDLWVSSEDALPYALAFIERYLVQD